MTALLLQLTFAGALLAEPGIQQDVAKIVTELKSRGFRLNDPLRIEPLQTREIADSRYAGGWSPGVIKIRWPHTGSQSLSQLLRHELYHEAFAQTCGDAPVVLSEYGALSFSGESDTSGKLDVSIKNLSRAQMLTLVEQHGPLLEPCRMPVFLERPAVVSAEKADHLLMHLYSARVLYSVGDVKTPYPIGSLHKLPFVAALPEKVWQSSSQAWASALLTSDDKFFVSRANLLQTSLLDDLYQRSMQKFPAAVLVGHRDTTRAFPLQYGLIDAAHLLRRALVQQPERLVALGLQGVTAGSTLASAPLEVVRLARALRAGVKTGTVADGKGKPLFGYQAWFWPSDEPQYLLLVRAHGTPGFAAANQVVRQWQMFLPELNKLPASVAIKPLARLPRAAWKVTASCPYSMRSVGLQGYLWQSSCGQFVIKTTAANALPTRTLAGAFWSRQRTLQDEQLIFLTDPLTYAESVATSEAGETHAAVRDAVGLLAASNALSSGKRHDLPRTLAQHWNVAKVVCDTTHCAVFRVKQPPDLAAQSWQKFHSWWRDLLWVAGLTPKIGQDPGWIAFANGGDKPWEAALTAGDIAARLHASSVLDLVRERQKNGAVMIRATSATDVTSMSCEIFRSKLKLLSCPEVISYNSVQRKWRFSGRGEGHGEGFSILEADRDAQAGLAMRELLRKAFNISVNDRLQKNKG